MTKSMNPKAQAVFEFMEANFHRKLRISELARSVYLSHSRLDYLFRMEFGMSPSQYLKLLRMQKACELLKTSLQSIKQIASMVGYNDDSHFMRDFKKTYGVTPTQYRMRKLELVPVIDELTRQNKKIG